MTITIDQFWNAITEGNPHTHTVLIKKDLLEQLEAENIENKYDFSELIINNHYKDFFVENYAWMTHIERFNKCQDNHADFNGSGWHLKPNNKMEMIARASRDARIKDLRGRLLTASLTGNLEEAKKLAEELKSLT